LLSLERCDESSDVGIANIAEKPTINQKGGIPSAVEAQTIRGKREKGALAREWGEKGTGTRLNQHKVFEREEVDVLCGSTLDSEAIS